MTVRATVICETAEPSRVYGARGQFEFAACPRIGEEIFLRYAGPRGDVFVVQRVSHAPHMPDEAALREAEAQQYGEALDDCPLVLHVAFVRSTPG